MAGVDWSRTGVYGHSWGGDAACRACAETDLNLTACGLLHPAIMDDMDQGKEAKEMDCARLHAGSALQQSK